MNKECEQIQIIALTEYLQINIEIEYLDGRFYLFILLKYVHNLSLRLCFFEALNKFLKKN